MIYLIWSTLNLTILFYFLYLIVGFMIKGKLIFRPQYKMVSIFIMVIGVIQIISAFISEKNTNQIKITDDYNNENYTDVKKVILQDNLTFNINLSVKYSVNDTEYIPIESSSSLTGFVSGYVWEFQSIHTKSFKKGQKSIYTAEGVLKWNLFGFTVYNESKTFNRTIK